MNKRIFSLVCALFFTTIAFAQISKIEGAWYTIDEDGNRKSLVKIYKLPNGIYEGAIIKLFTGAPDRRCDKCTGENKNKPIVGMKIITGMKIDEQKLSEGTILDPATGKIYSCIISFDAKKSKLKVRGSLDKSGFIGRTQYWERAPAVN